MKNELFLIFLVMGLSFATNSTHSQTSIIEVNIPGAVPDAVREAVDYTADLWSQYLISDIPIKINMLYIPFPGFLGISFPNGVKNFAGAPLTDTWFPTSLANAISAIELNPGEFDADIFMSSVPNWYFGTDANPAADQIDFVSVFMHEIAHSLGFLSLAKVENGLGSLGEIKLEDFGLAALSFPFPDLEGLPSAFDRLLVNGNSIAIADTSVFPNASVSLASQMTGDDIFISGPNSSNVIDGQLPRIFAPNPFVLGSSCTHLDEVTYMGEDALMTPFAESGEAFREPGELTLAILKDLGWQISTTTSSAERHLQDHLVQVFPNPSFGIVNFRFTLDKPVDVGIHVYDILGKEITVVSTGKKQAGNHQFTLDLQSVVKPGLGESAMYIYQISIEGKKQAGKLLISYH